VQALNEQHAEGRHASSESWETCRPLEPGTCNSPPTASMPYLVPQAVVRTVHTEASQPPTGFSTAAQQQLPQEKTCPCGGEVRSPGSLSPLDHILHGNDGNDCNNDGSGCVDEQHALPPSAHNNAALATSSPTNRPDPHVLKLGTQAAIQQGHQATKQHACMHASAWSTSRCITTRS
jgi:hypothetical protein